MSNASTPAVRTYGVISAETIGELMLHGATEKTAYAVAWRDGGFGTNEEGGLSMKDVFGAPVKSGGFGNLVTAGLRKLGREADVASSGTGGTRAPRVGPIMSFADHVKAYKSTMDAKAAALEAAYTRAVEAVEAFDADAVVNVEIERLTTERDTLTATIAALRKAPDSFTDNIKGRMIENADTLRNVRDEGLVAIAAELTEAGLA